MPAANPHRGEVAIELGGKVYVLRPSYDAIVEARQTTGVPLGESFARIANLDLVEMASIVGPAMRASGHKLTDRQVGQLLMEKGAANAVKEVSTLLKNMLTGGAEPEGEAEAAGR